LSVKGIVFDLDGTLLDTLQSIGAAFNRTLTRMKMPEWDIDAYRYFIGEGVYKCAERCLPETHRTEETINRLVELEREDYSRNWEADAGPYDGIEQLILDAKSRGLSLAVLSNKDDGFAKQCVNHYFPDSPFDSIIGYSSSVPHKPDPTGAGLVAQKLGLQSEELVMVGDTSIDIHTAQACNMHSIGVLWGFRDLVELEMAGADKIIQRPDELLSAIELF
jgi:phosphoglycolate phosphatase